MTLAGTFPPPWVGGGYFLTSSPLWKCGATCENYGNFCFPRTTGMTTMLTASLPTSCGRSWSPRPRDRPKARARRSTEQRAKMGSSVGRWFFVPDVFQRQRDTPHKKMFSSGPNYSKLKTNLRLCINRWDLSFICLEIFHIFSLRIPKIISIL